MDEERRWANDLLLAVLLHLYMLSHFRYMHCPQAGAESEREWDVPRAPSGDSQDT